MFNRIKNIIRWLPIIWSDHDWDYIYLFEILRFKIKNMEEFFNSKYTHILRSEDVAKELHICKLLLDRILNDNYYYTVFLNHDKKWGESEISYEDSDKEGFKRILLTRKNIITPKDEKQERKEFLRLCNREDMLHKQDIKYLFHIMNRKIRTWWD